MSDNNYNADSIDLLSDIDHVRMRRGMYIGEAYNPNHLFSEAFDNALDEDMSGYVNKPMEIVINKDTNSYIIRDFGRGLPQGDKELEDGTKQSVINILFTQLKSGGKFNNNNYKISGGLHGMGDCIINALSKYLEVTSFREDYIETHKFEYGKEVFSEIKENVDKLESGTLLHFIPDPEMFDTDKISVDFVTNRCRVASAFGYKSKLVVIDGKNIDTINTESNIHDLITDDGSDISEYLFIDGEAKDKNTGESIKYALWYTSDTSCHNKSYTNLLPNSQGGTHVNIFYSAFEDAWSRFKVSDILPKDLYIGMRFVVSAFLSETAFSSQTKDKLTVNRKDLNRFVKPLSDDIYKKLCESDKDVIKGLIRRFQEHRASQNKLLAKKEIRDLIVLNKDTSGNVRRRSVVTKLKECTSRSREDTEVHICEGDSAAGPLITNRDKVTQAILPIRGKILNVSRYGGDLVKSLNNDEVRSIVNAAGTGILDECDVSRSRYERYIIDTDADQDGLQISSLVVSLFVNLLGNIVKAGMLYVSVPPLYGWYEGKEFKFGNDINEIPSGTHFERFKGLGQMNPNEIKDTLLDKNKRTLMRIEYPEDLNRFNEILTSPSAKYDILFNLGLIKYID